MSKKKTKKKFNIVLALCTDYLFDYYDEQNLDYRSTLEHTLIYKFQVENRMLQDKPCHMLYNVHFCVDSIFLV